MESFTSELHEGTLRLDVENNKAFFTPNGGAESEIPVDSKKCADIMMEMLGSKTDKAVAS